LQAVEFWSWRNKNLGDIAAALDETGLGLTGFLVDPRHAIVDPASHAEFLASVRESVAVAQTLGAGSLIVLTSNERPGVSRAAQHAAAVSALRQAAPIAEDAGVQLVLEPLNSVVNHPGCFLTSTLEGLDMVEEVGSPAVRLLYDLYHSVVMGEHPAQVLASRGHLVGHVHLADAPGRHEPGTGEIDFPACLRVITEAGYSGPIGLEFRPSGRTDAAIEATRVQLRMP
jgi:hydroxypyruvate isomerase